MKRVGKIVVCLASGLALSASLFAVEDTSTNNPYTLIPARNVFGLNPPQLVTNTSTIDPPVKITPNGIMTISGMKQVLFKVAGVAKPGVPAKDDSYILGEGQRQDDIEVTHIDEKNGIISFNNHGVAQQLPLAAAPTITAPTPVAARPVTVNTTSGNIPNPNGGNGNAGNGRGFGRFGRNRDGNTGNSSGGNNGSNLRNTPTQQQTQQIDPDTQMIMMEANRQLTADQVKRGELPPIPPTELTPSDAPGYTPPAP
ncbi:MAG TPA: hypothetical protein VHG89_12150 [Verrucomicrobiae bacterium]|nr:hypothetical protein [Verrucomicrobiae bacterium]